MSFFNFCGLGRRQPATFDSVDDPNRWDDESCGINCIQGLGYDNFKEFMSEKDLTLVFFYHPDYRATEAARMNFIQAAHNSHRHTHFFAAVNCLQEPELCCREKVDSLPHFKLYANGNDVSSEDPANLDFRSILSWMEAFNIC